MTFTNKAAKEMKERVALLLFSQAKIQAHISTFHSFGASLLRIFHEDVSLPRDFQIYDTNDQQALVTQAVEGISAQEAKAIVRKISFLKDRGITHFSNDPLMNDLHLSAQTYQKYEELKKNTGNVDFGDLLLLPYLLLKKNKQALQMVQKRWIHCLVDEYQDTNSIQFLFLELLYKHNPHFTVVGDDDQSIYKFRGAIVDNILSFSSHFPGSRIIRLEENYRSSKQILDLAKDVVSHNTKRHSKDVFSSTNEGETPHVIQFDYELAEQKYVVELARKANEKNKSLGIFFRINSLSRGYEEALVQAGIPYELVGAVSFYEREEIKDAIALLRLYKNKHDIISFRRIVNKPRRSIGAKTIASITQEMAKGRNWEEVKNILWQHIPAAAQKGLDFFSSCMSHNSLEKEPTVGACLAQLFRSVGLWEHYTEEDKASNSERRKNVEELVSFASGFSNENKAWQGFFEQISLVEGRLRNVASKIQLMSLHRSKGLEFDMVLICGIEEGILPMGRDFEDIDIEEERRLFYVGVTRAKEFLALSYCKKRQKYGFLRQTFPSSFLLELKQELVNMSFYEYTSEERLLQKHSHDEGQGYYPVHKKNDYHNNYHSEGNSNEHPVYESKWMEGDEVEHKSYGSGKILQVRNTNKHCIIKVVFTDGREAMFLPQYSSAIQKKAKHNEG
ncbi:DNA helicase II-like [Ylistrum balloti]|uniref:DNA helicase II-like n=1 Tax=Ylistrum balloti TaxID=509963 RepID=UPI002905D4AF|nr:DNA helicase II-like [Ylistrum balloti]